MKPHKHAELIKLWADGAEIEARFLDADGWTNWRLQEGGFIWYKSGAEYRIKPKPDVAKNFYINYLGKIPVMDIHSQIYNLRLIWDGETGEFKSAEVI